jgi:DnaK suppressor protein
LAKKPALKVVSKSAAKPAAGKKVAAPAANKAASLKSVGKPAASKRAKPTAPKTGVSKNAAPVSKKALPKPISKTVAPASPAKASAKKTEPVAAPVRPAPAPVATAPAKGKGAAAGVVAVATPRVASATARHTPPNKEKPSQSAMNSNVANQEHGLTKEDGRYALPSSVNIELPKGYRPSSNSDEEYMGPRQLAYFRNKLRDWRDQLVEESRQTMENLRDEVRDVGDEAERATRETENSLELRTRDRYRKLISKIDKALRRIEEGRYGYCEETDEEIGVERLDARPIATLSLDAQERREHLQKQMGD